MKVIKPNNKVKSKPNLVITGKCGSGKTTLVNTIADLFEDVLRVADPCLLDSLFISNFQHFNLVVIDGCAKEVINDVEHEVSNQNIQTPIIYTTFDDVSDDVSFFQDRLTILNL